jgi:type I restriction enzyme R subunit
MPTPGEHKTVQARILAYAQEIGWTYVSRGEAERRRGFDPDGVTLEALLGEFRRLSADIAGNRDFLIYLRNQGKFFCAEQNRELDLTLIDYGDLARPREAW